MKLVKKIKGLFRKQPLTAERVAAMAEAESTRQQVQQEAAEIRDGAGRNRW
jgi:hypothetical protein